MSWSLPDIYVTWSNLSSFHVNNFVTGYFVKFILSYLWLMHFMCCICRDHFLTYTFLGQIYRPFMLPILYLVTWSNLFCFICDSYILCVVYVLIFSWHVRYLVKFIFFVCDSPKRFSPFFLHDWRICSIHQMAQMICLHLKVQTDIIHSKFSHETVQYTPNSWTIHLSAKMKLLWHLLMILAICVQS